MPNFVHLHNHTDFSILDGAAPIDKLVNRAVELGQKALGVTEHGNMFSINKFEKTCREADIKPILGCECYMARGGSSRRDKTLDRKTPHITLLAENKVGYRNLVNLVSKANTEGFYYKPRIDIDMLRAYAQGIICLSGCVGGVLPYQILHESEDKVRQTVQTYIDIFGKDHFFIELQRHNIEDEEAVYPTLLSLASDYGLPLVATNDLHYVTQEDWKVQDLLFTIQTNQRFGDPNRKTFVGDHAYYLKSEEEMRELGFPDEAYTNTLIIADRCNVELSEFRAKGLPCPHSLDTTKGQDDDILRSEAQAGLQSYFKKIPINYQERLDYELETIVRCGFSRYMLICRDFLRYCRQNNIYTGSRGSAAGSLVSYALRITDVDPIFYGLTFERFLNAERVEMPDIDIDIQDDRRPELVGYARDRYGLDKVSQIATFGTFKTRGGIRDVSRVYGVSSLGETLSKLVPAFPLNITVDEAMEKEPALRTTYKYGDPMVKTILDGARSLEGLHKTQGVHPAGIVVSDTPLSNIVPLMHSKDETIVIQADMDTVTDLGLLKMDFLGLSNLTILARTISLLRDRGVKIDISKIPLDDQVTFDALSRGVTSGVFQLSSYGMTKHIRALKPNSIKNLAAMVALYRPGPMEHIQEYIDRKTGRKKIEYPHKDLQHILEDTYGVIVYQDQVLQIANQFAGFSLGRADVLRKAMGKKKPEVMQSCLKEFIQGASAKGYSEDTANKVFNLIIPFAGYAFNKAHATCYAILAYQTAYLLTHYPLEYYTCLFEANSDSDDRDTLKKYIQEAETLGIRVGQPTIKTSGTRFAIDGSCIRVGLSAIKGVGIATAEKIIQMRNQPEYMLKHMNELYDFFVTSGLRTNVIQALIYAGALDHMGSRGELTKQVPFLAKLKLAYKSGKEAKIKEILSEIAKTPVPVKDWDDLQLQMIGLVVAPEPMESILRIRFDDYNRDIADLLRSKPGESRVILYRGNMQKETDIYVRVDGVLLRALDSARCRYIMEEVE